MIQFKCKICGGNISVSENDRVCTCEYCGTKQAVPRIETEKQMALFKRANRYLAECEFDRAAAVFEGLLEDFPTEAEAQWGLLLCQYGIQYVDDPKTGKKVKTCHKTSYNSVLESENYQAAVKLAEGEVRELYQSEAAEIEQIRLRIVEEASKLDPFDIFICYKETDDAGDRTPDSVLAEEVYSELTKRGYKVFFSRITLESQLGKEYEPVIFSALKTSKIMLAFGTCDAYFNAPWVRNEWSRFIQLKDHGMEKVLIPCYKDMDPAKLPVELTRFQGQDLGKVGAMQDLLRGIEKIIPKQGNAAVPVETKANRIKKRIIAITAIVVLLVAGVLIFITVRANGPVKQEASIELAALPAELDWQEDGEVARIRFVEDSKGSFTISHDDLTREFYIYSNQANVTEYFYYDGSAVENIGDNILDYLNDVNSMKLLKVGSNVMNGSSYFSSEVVKGKNIAMFIFHCRSVGSITRYYIDGYYVGTTNKEGSDYYIDMHKCHCYIGDSENGLLDVLTEE